MLGWFTFTTQAHENHLFVALPVLSLAWPNRRTLLIPFAVVSVTLFLNMFLHDQLVLETLGLNVDDQLVQQLRLINAVLNVGCFVAWSVWACARKVEPEATFDHGRPLGYSELVPIGVEARSD